MAVLETIYESGRVVRYHANPRLNPFNQTNADHTWGVLAILFKLHPDPSMNLIKFATFHDAGELFAGDLSHPFKRDYPEFAKEHARIEFALARGNGIPGMDIQLTEEEHKWLSLSDRLESYLFARVYAPQEANKWLLERKVQDIQGLAEELGCINQVKEVFHVGEHA